MATKTVKSHTTIRFPPQVTEALQREAQRLGMSMSEVVLMRVEQAGKTCPFCGAKRKHAA